MTNKFHQEGEENNNVSKKDKYENYILPEYLDKLPSSFLPKVFETLPAAFRKVFNEIDDENEMGMLLLSMLTVLSGTMPNVTLQYDRKMVYTNLYLFIIAPAAGGKGSMSWARLLGEPIHQMLLDESNKLRNEFRASNHNKSGLKEKEPSRKLLFIPANSSSSSFLKTLSENDGAGSMISSEADTLTDTLAQEWGNFSPILRMAFHHEVIEQQRRTGDEYFRIPEPKLTILLSGTPSQVLKLMPSSEDGLFSRFMYYYFQPTQNFRNVFKAHGKNPEPVFKAFGIHCLEIYKFLKAQDVPFEFELSEKNQIKFLKEFEEITMVTRIQSGPEISATVKRLGLITMRIATILTVIRQFETFSKSVNRKVVIADQDFKIAIQLMYTLLYNASIQLAEIPRHNDNVKRHNIWYKIFNQLPESFTRQNLMDVATKYGFSSAKVSRALTRNLYSERTAHGTYKKRL